MAACAFNIPISGNVSELLDKAKNAIQGNGGIFEGDLTTGNFAVPVIIGKIVGTYTIKDQLFQIEISDKPMMVSCSLIEEQLKKYLTKEAQA